MTAGGNGQRTSNNQLSNPRGIQYVSSSNSVYIANNEAHNIVRWVIGASSWILVTGTLLSYPTYVLVEPMGNVYGWIHGDPNTFWTFSSEQSHNVETMEGR